MILINVLGLLDQQLPAYIKTRYTLKMQDKRLMDFKTDIFTNFSKFIEEIEVLEQLSALRVNSPKLAAANSYGRSPGYVSYWEKDNVQTGPHRPF